MSHDVWSILELLVQTNGCITYGPLTSCVSCGEGIYTLPGQWKHTDTCLFFRLRYALDDQYQQQGAPERVQTLYHEIEVLRQTDTIFNEWIQQILE